MSVRLSDVNQQRGAETARRAPLLTFDPHALTEANWTLQRLTCARFK